MEKVRLWAYRIALVLCIVLLVWTNKDSFKRGKAQLDEANEALVNQLLQAVAGQDYRTGATITSNIDSEDVTKVINGSASGTYVDERKPDYDMVPLYTELPVENEYTWTSFEGLYYATICYTIDAGLYNYYKNLPRYYGDNEYINYIDDPMNDSYVSMVVENIEEIGGRRGYSRGEMVREAVSFCQGFEYELDENTSNREEWPKYPIELLFERAGDCEDSSILLAGVLKKMGYGVVLIKYDDHMAVGIKADGLEGTCFTLNDQRYYYIETTNPGWKIGEIPDDYIGLTPTLILIN